MGLYIDPENQSKEDFLAENGERIGLGTVAEFTAWNGEKALVCLVDNVQFTAAAIVAWPEERERFLRGMGGRKSSWWLVPVDKLKPWLPREFGGDL